MVKTFAAKTHDTKVSINQVNSVFKKKMDYRYRKVRKQPIHVNTERCLVLR